MLKVMKLIIGSKNTEKVREKLKISGIVCTKYVRIRVFTDPYSPVKEQNLFVDFVLIRENTGQ